ncbi:MAG: hypothetical protein HY906_16210 [Deltaproteobacteria bacterium]|nr:hypothetical protein [Deltaproteobacteria bacterium]
MFLPRVGAAQGFCPTVAATASLDGCSLPGAEWGLTCSPGASLESTTTTDGNCWLVSTVPYAPPSEYAECRALRTEPALGTAPAWWVEFRTQVAEVSPECLQQSGSSCTHLAVIITDAQRTLGFDLVTHPAAIPDGQGVGLTDGPPEPGSAEKAHMKWIPLDLGVTHSLRAEATVNGDVRFLIDGVLVYTIPYTQLPGSLGWAPNVETFLTKHGTVWLDYLTYAACGATPTVAPPGSPMFQVSAITLPRAWDPALGPLWLSATASILTSGATDPRNPNFRYEVRHEYQIIDSSSRQTLAALNGVVPVDLKSAPRGGYLVAVPVATSWNGTTSTGAVIPTGSYPVALSADVVRIHVKNGQEKPIGTATTTGTLNVLKCMKILTPEPGTWLGGRDYKTTPTTIKFLVVDNTTCNRTTRVNFDLRLPPGGPDILGASGATQPFENEAAYVDPHNDGTQFPLTYPGLKIDSVQYATVQLGTVSFSGRVVTALVSLPATPYQDSPGQLLARLSDAAGEDYGGDAVTLNYDTAGPKLEPRGTFVADDDFDDVGTVQRLCVESSEPLASIDVNVRPIGSTNWSPASLDASAASSYQTQFGTYVFCWDDARVPGTDGATDGYDYQIVASDVHGNPSDPLPGRVVCQVPERFVVPQGQRVGITVDHHNVPHVVYTTANAVRYVRWSRDSWKPVQRYPDAPDWNVWGEPVWCLYGWAYHGLAGDREFWDCRDRLPDEPELQWGANVDIAIGPDREPAVCAVFGPKVSSGTWLGNEYGTVAVFQRPASPPSPQPFPWTWSPVYSDYARFYNCALVAGVAVPRPPTSGGPPDDGLALMFTAPTASPGGAAPAFSLIRPGSTLMQSGFEVVDDTSHGLDVAMTVAPDGTFHAVYTDRYPAGFGPTALHHAYGGAGNWRTEVVQSFTSYRQFARLPSIARDSSGQLHVAYSLLNEWMGVVDNRFLYYMRRPTPPSAWETPQQVDGDLPGITLSSGEPFLEGMPARVVMGRDAAGEERAEIVYLSSTRWRKNVDFLDQPELVQPDIAQLLLAFNPGGSPDPGWQSNTLATRIDDSTGLAAATSPTGRRRVAYHNGLAGQLFYEQEENGNMAFLGPHYLPLAVGCAARSRDPATGGTRPRFVATSDDPVPGDLMNLPVGRTRPPYPDDQLPQLFRDLRAYGYDWIDNVPKPPGFETVDWRTINEADQAMWVGISQQGRATGNFYMGDLLVYANELLAELSVAQCPAGADTSLGGCWRAALGPVALGQLGTYLRAPDVAQESIVESAFRNVRMQSGSIPKLEAKGVCLPSPGISCDLVAPELEQRAPSALPTLYPAPRAIAYDSSRPLADQIAECAAFVHTYGLGDGRVIVGNGATIGSVGDGCYVCWPAWLAPGASTLWLGVTPGDTQPYCGPAACPGGGRFVGQSRSVLQCRPSGCDLVGCAQGCQQPPSYEMWEGDEQYVDPDSSGTCSRCPPGTTPARCRGGDQVPPLASGIDEAVCEGGQWRPRVKCSVDADCDAPNQYRCKGGWCRNADDVYQVAPRPLCIPYGCQECYRNLYCVSGFQLCLDPLHDGANATCTYCPRNHACTAEDLADPAVAAPLCFGRPFLDDFRVHAALSYASSGEIDNLAGGLLDMFSTLRFPTKAGGYDISVDERLAGAGFRFGGATFNQGYLEFTLRFKDDFNIWATCDVEVKAPVILRVRMQPYFAADDTNVADPPYYHGATRWRVTHAHIIHDMLTGERPPRVSACAKASDAVKGALTSLEQEFFDATQANLQPAVEALWRRLTGDMIVGGWLFGRENAIRALHTAEDVIHITGAPDQGDNDPTVSIEAMRLWPPPDPASPRGGTAVLWYRER